MLFRSWVWERKYEVDSLAFPILLLENYYEKTQDVTIFSEGVIKAIELIIENWVIEQEHEAQSMYSFERDSKLKTETLQNNGKGSKVVRTGMTWSGFRPSDDACTYHYLIPSNMLAVVVLERLKELPLESDILNSAQKLAGELREGIQKYGIINHQIGRAHV